MDESQFARRIAKIRTRFAAKLSDKIQETDAILPRLAGDGSDAIEAVATVYRHFHDVCSIGASVGFEATGRSAKPLDVPWAGPFRDHRELPPDELLHLRQGLESLRIAAHSEIQLSEPTP